jgi:uncharacterized membrane protein
MSNIDITFFVSLVITLAVSMTLAIYENAHKTPKFEKSLNVTLVIGMTVLFVSSVLSVHWM